MKKKHDIPVFADLTLWLILVGGFILSACFGLCVYIAQEEVNSEAERKMELSMLHIQTYIEAQLMRIEDIAYSFVGYVELMDNGQAMVKSDINYLHTLTKEIVVNSMTNLVINNENICGAYFYIDPAKVHITGWDNRQAVYVYQFQDSCHVVPLGTGDADFKHEPWFRIATEQQAAVWTPPFREQGNNEVVADFVVPFYVEDVPIGLFALSANTDYLREHCSQIAPFQNAEIMLLDSSLQFISCPDAELEMQPITMMPHFLLNKADSATLRDIQNGANGNVQITLERKKQFFHYSTVHHTNWIVTIECPWSGLFGGVEKMQRQTAAIAVITLILLIVCFIIIFRHMQKTSKEKTIAEEQISIAAKIQFGMLPQEYPAFPKINQLDIHGFLRPAKQIGGDFYDYLIRDNMCFFCIGDVSGKGVPASLYMAIMHALFRHVSQFYDSPATIMEALNKTLAENNEKNMFCTMFLGVIHLQTGRFVFCNAGHNVPVIRQIDDNGNLIVRYIHEYTNIALGIIPDIQYKEEEAIIHPSEALFFYTDGITEAENTHHHVFGEEALLQAIHDAQAKQFRSANEFVNGVYNTVVEFADGAPQTDDITILVVKYNGNILHLTNDIHRIPELHTWLLQWQQAYAITEEKFFQINLALEEAVANCMQYAYPEQQDKPVDIIVTSPTIDSTTGATTLTFYIEDQGVPFDPTQVETPDISLPVEQRPIGGLGIMLTRQLSASVSYARVLFCNRLTIVFNL